VSLQTFYRYFASKDELLLALIADAMTKRAIVGPRLCRYTDPMDRLRFYITAPLEWFDAIATKAGMRFIVSTHCTCTASSRMSSPRPGSRSSISSSRVNSARTAAY